MGGPLLQKESCEDQYLVLASDSSHQSRVWQLILLLERLLVQVLDLYCQYGFRVNIHHVLAVAMNITDLTKTIYFLISELKFNETHLQLAWFGLYQIMEVIVGRLCWLSLPEEEDILRVR